MEEEDNIDFIEEFKEKMVSVMKLVSKLVKQDFEIKEIKIYREIGIPEYNEFDGITDLIPVICAEEWQPNTLFYLDSIMETEEKDFHLHIMFYYNENRRVMIQNIEIDELALESELPDTEITKRVYSILKKLRNYFAEIIKYIIEDWIRNQFK